MRPIAFCLSCLTICLLVSCGRQADQPAAPSKPATPPAAAAPAPPAPVAQPAPPPKAPEPPAPASLILMSLAPEQVAGQDFITAPNQSNQIYINKELPFTVTLPGGEAVVVKSGWTILRAYSGIVSETAFVLPADDSYEGACRALAGALAANPVLKTDDAATIDKWPAVPAEERKEVNTSYPVGDKVKVKLALTKSGGDWKPGLNLVVERDAMKLAILAAAKAWAAAPDKDYTTKKDMFAGLAISADSRKLGVAKRGRLDYFDIGTGQVDIRVEEIGKTRIDGSYGLAVDPDGERFALVGEDGDVTVIDAANRTVLSEVPKGKHTIAILPDFSGYLRGSDEGIFVCSLDGKELRKLEGDDLLLASREVSPDSTRVLVQLPTRNYAVYSITSGKKVLDLESAGKVFHTSFSADNSVIAGCEFMNQQGIILWDGTTGKILRNIQTEAHNIVALSPDGKYVVGATWSAWFTNYAAIFDVATGKQIKELGRFLESPWRVRFTPDGKTLVIPMAHDSHVYLWNVPDLLK